MPSKAGRVRMPPDNRLPVSASLKTSDIWKNSVGYDPYASVEEINKRELKKQEETNEEINEKAKSLFSLARLTGTASATIPGACTLCNHIGHLPYQCRNLISLEKLNFQSDIKEEAEDDLKERRNLGIVSDSDGSDGSSSDDGSDSSSGRSSSGERSSSGTRDSRDSAREKTKKEKDKKRRRKREKRRDKREGRSWKEESRSHRKERSSHRKESRSHKREKRTHEEKRSRKHEKRTRKDKAERRRHSSRDSDKPNVKKKEKRKRRTTETYEESVRGKRHRRSSSSS
ncbi:hypothetical protein C922_01228 [Plasmodium inui San Antonio 1]|uniref:Uncharacterized protein n=1 Tax=Plasmodium inui San Antonio 1 TaxID=1237626 RepID=W7A964_9APIC|nr:hypothetical protein C922_01228 [Plasmodium inui San Antonio 1]EUD68210.1 hypothetical protein C922_01228 [Plasmodium inui San Antonio 1]